MDFRSDARVYGIGDQFLAGPALMVCPVTAPGVKTRAVYLPAGGRWTDFWTGASYAGGQHVDATAPIETVPLFVRAGSIVPLGPSLQYTSEKPADPLEVRVYRGADGDFALYEDVGDGYDYERGAYAVIPMHWNERRATLTIGARKGTFPGMLRERRMRIVWVGPDHGNGITASTGLDAEIVYRGDAVVVRPPSRDRARHR